MQRFLNTAVLSLAILALTAATATFAEAQQSDPQQASQPRMHQPDPTKEARRLGKQLGLSPDQISQVQTVFADREQRVQCRP
jgi:Spy/CpxP family protein refolding chaperone